MTVSSTISVAGPFTGNGSTTNFPFTFKVLDQADLRVVHTTALGVESDYTIVTNYTVNLNADQNASPGGSIDLVVALPSGEKVTIVRETTVTQEVDLENQGAWQPEIVETALDRLTMAQQELSDVVDRTVKVDVSSGDNPDALLDSITQAVTDTTNNVSAASTSETNSANSAGYSAEWANKAEDSLVSAAAGGDEVDDYSALHHSAKASAQRVLAETARVGAETAETNAALSAASAAEKPSRNCALNQEPVTQGTSTATGMSSTIYTGNGSTQSITTGVDMATGDNGGLVWIKSRDQGTVGYTGHSKLYDTVRGVSNDLETNTTDPEANDATGLTTFGSTGFSVGAKNTVNFNTDNFVAWSFGTNKKTPVNAIFPSDMSTHTLLGVTSSVVDGPESSGSSALRLTEDSGTSQRRLRDTTENPLVLSSGDVLNASVRVKPYGDRTNILLLVASDVSDDTLQEFRLSDLTIGSASASVGTISNAQISQEDDGYYRLSLDLNLTSSITTTGIWLFFSNVYGDGNTTYAGDGVSYIDVADAQITEGSGVKWFCPTTTAASGPLTNRGKEYTCHYNADMGFSIVGYEATGEDGHEVPTHLGRKSELTIIKSRDSTAAWLISSPHLNNGVDYLQWDTDAAATASPYAMQFTEDYFSVIGSSSANVAGENTIAYNFASVPGVSKVGRYIGTGDPGNYVECGFKPSFVLVKNLSDIANWHLADGIRGDGALLANTSGAEITGTDYIDLTEGGFVLKNNGVTVNALNDEFLFLAFAETSSDATKAWADFTYPTSADTLSIQQNTLLSFANGFNASGQVDAQETVGAGVTHTLGVGHENKHYWLYKDKAGSYGVTEHRPLTGLTRNDADTWGEPSPLDASLRTTATHFDYESATGVASASSEEPTYLAYHAFTKMDPAYTGASGATWFAVSGTTTGWVQYKHSEKRVLKSWRLMETIDQTYSPRRFTIEGSNDGLNWTAIDSSYAAADYTGNGVRLWGDLQDTSANTTAYLYHRINITANNGNATWLAFSELEFNTILPSDYYLVDEGKMYNSSNVGIERVYLAELQTNSAGEVIWYENLPVAKQNFTDVTVHGELEVRGEIHNPAVATAWVNFDGTQNPPLIRDSFNVSDVVDLGTGIYEAVFEAPMDISAYAAVAASENSNGYCVGTDTLSVNKFRIVNYTTANAASDSDSLSVASFGGKKEQL